MKKCKNCKFFEKINKKHGLCKKNHISITVGVLKSKKMFAYVKNNFVCIEHKQQEPETDREFKQIQHICCNQEMKSLCDNKDVMIDLFTCQICGQKMQSNDKGNKRDGML